MADEDHLTILKQGITAWNRWRSTNPTTRPSIAGTLLIDRNFKDADFRNTIFEYVDFYESFLVNASFRDAFLAKVDLSRTRLMGASFRGAKLAAVNIHKAWLVGADFGGAEMAGVVFSSADLRGVRGLEDVIHAHPSSIDIETIYRSKGRIPESFLRGCGVPENLIRYIPSLVNSEDGIQFYSCFISYSSKDEGFARRLHGRMRDARLRVWFATEDIQAGRKLHEQIETAIRVYDKLLIVLSEASLQSEWVMDELRKGFKAERDTGKRKLFPVRLIDYETLQRWECRDSLSGRDLAEEVRQYFIPDFSNWRDHDQFEAAFSRLLKDLRAEERAK